MAIALDEARFDFTNVSTTTINPSQTHRLGALAGAVDILFIFDWNAASSTAWTIPTPSAGENAYTRVGQIHPGVGGSLHVYSRSVPQGQQANAGSWVSPVGSSQVGISSIHTGYTGLTTPVTVVLATSDTHSASSGSSVLRTLGASSAIYQSAEVELICHMGIQLNSSFGGATGMSTPTPLPAGFTTRGFVGTNNAGQGYYHEFGNFDDITTPDLGSRGITYVWDAAATQRPHINTVKILINPIAVSSSGGRVGVLGATSSFGGGDEGYS